MQEILSIVFIIVFTALFAWGLPAVGCYYSCKKQNPQPSFVRCSLNMIICFAIIVCFSFSVSIFRSYLITLSLAFLVVIMIINRFLSIKDFRIAFFITAFLFVNFFLWIYFAGPYIDRYIIM